MLRAENVRERISQRSNSRKKSLAFFLLHIRKHKPESAASTNNKTIKTGSAHFSSRTHHHHRADREPNNVILIQSIPSHQPPSGSNSATKQQHSWVYLGLEIGRENNSSSETANHNHNPTPYSKCKISIIFSNFPSASQQLSYASEVIEPWRVFD